MKIATIMTDRLILKDIKLEDATLLVSKIYTKENTQYLYKLQNPTLEDMILYVGEVVNDYKRIFTKNLVFGITSNDVLVGTISLRRDNIDRRTYDIGWIMDPMYQRMGFTFEAANAVMNYCKKHGVKKITAHADVKNIPSISLMEKLGMKRTNEINNRVYPNGDKSYEIVYEIAL